MQFSLELKFMPEYEKNLGYRKANIDIALLNQVIDTKIVCKENVRLVESESSLFLAIEFNQCVAIPFDITRTHKQLNMPLVGSIRKSKN